MTTPLFVSAEETPSPVSSTSDIARLEAEIAKLQAHIVALTQGAKATTTPPSRSVRKLERQIRSGDTGLDVTLLQEVLATDPEVYPEGRISGTYGPLTERAVRRFQEKQGIAVVGIVGPRTKELLNRYLQEAKVTDTGVVPKDLLQKSRPFVVLPLYPQHHSGMKGWARLTERENGSAMIELEIVVAGKSSTSTHPAFLRLGSCPAPNFAVAELVPVVEGRSVTMLHMPYRELMGRSALAINIHRSRDLDSIDLACGDVVVPPGMMRWDGKES